MKITFNLAKLMQEYLDNNPDVTKFELSERVGVMPNTITRYMKDDMQQPKLDVVSRICEVIGVTDITQVFLVEYEEKES